MITERPHFVSACWPFTCSRCLKEFPANSLMMPYADYAAARLNRRPPETERLCEVCGKLLLETT